MSFWLKQQVLFQMEEDDLECDICREVCLNPYSTSCCQNKVEQSINQLLIRNLRMFTFLRDFITILNRKQTKK